MTDFYTCMSRSRLLARRHSARRVQRRRPVVWPEHKKGFISYRSWTQRRLMLRHAALRDRA